MSSIVYTSTKRDCILLFKNQHVDIIQIVITFPVLKIIFLNKSRYCQADQQSYSCCLVSQEDEEIQRGKEFFISLKYKNCDIS